MLRYVSSLSIGLAPQSRLVEQQNKGVVLVQLSVERKGVD